jgi:biopolymer transport protein ExbD
MVREELSINITALIDVVFLLLIFFMITTTFNRETRLQLTLPKAQTELMKSQPAQIEIVVAKDGKYTVNGRGLLDRRTETLRQVLELESQGDINMPILLIADAEATHQSVISAMDAVGQSGFFRLNIATQRPEEIEQLLFDPN